MSTERSDQDPDPTLRQPASRGEPSPRPVPAAKPEVDATRVRPSGDDATLVHGAEPGVESTRVHADAAPEPTIARPSPRPEPPPPPKAPPPAPPRAQPPATAPATQAEKVVFAGRFEVVKLLGEGGMGRVYEVRDRQIEGRTVALKVLLPRFSKSDQFRKLFFQEVRAAQKFVSEQVVQVRDTGQMDDGSLFLTMDMVEGESLRSLLDRERVLRARHALEIAREMLLGLHSGHEKGFVHRDVKPSNVMLAAHVPKTDENPYGVGVRLLDFGIAGLAAEIGEGAHAGTAVYMSPEQAQGQRLDARSDLFAVGVCLYEMLSGARPFTGKSTREVIDSVIDTDLAAKVAEVEGLSPAVRRLLERALQKDREKRFQSALEFATAIEKSSAYQLPRVMPIWAMAALGVVALAAIGEGALLWKQSQEIQQHSERMRVADNQHRDALEQRGREHASALGEKDKTIEGLRDELSAEQQRVSTLTGEKSGLEAQLSAKQGLEASESKRLEDELKRVRDELKTAQEEYRAAKKAAEEAAARAQLAEKRAEEKERLANRDARLADAYDKLLELIENGLGDSAKERLAAAASEGLLATSQKDGAGFVRALVECAAQLVMNRESMLRLSHPDVAALTRAEQALGDAQRYADRFELEAQEWIGFRLEGKPDPDRATRGRAALAKLETELEAAMGAAEGFRLEQWAAIDAAPAMQDPKRAFELDDLYGGEGARRLLSRYAAEARQDAASGPSLDLAALAQVPFLGAWADRLRSKSAVAGSTDAADVVLLSYAQRWYDGDDANDEGFDWTGIALPAIAEPGKEWRNELALAWRLAQPDSGYPIRAGSRLVFRQVAAGGGVSWLIEDGPRDAVTGTTWPIQRKTYKEDAISLLQDQGIELVRRGKQVFIQGASAPLVNLRASGSNVSVAPMPAIWSGDLKPQLGVNPLSRQEFTADAAARGGPCLVVVQGDATRWFSARYGLVREELNSPAGRSVRELVFATPIQ